MKRWIVAALIVVLGAAGGFVYALVVKPTYTASASVSVLEVRQNGGGGRDVAFAQSLSRLSIQGAALTAAARDLGLPKEQLDRTVRGSVQPNSPIVYIDADARTPEESVRIAAGVAKALAAFGAATMDTSDVRVSVYNNGDGTARQTSPNRLLDTGVGVGAGVLVAALFLLATGGMRRPAAAPAAAPPLPGLVSGGNPSTSGPPNQGPPNQGPLRPPPHPTQALQPPGSRPYPQPNRQPGQPGSRPPAPPAGGQAPLSPPRQGGPRQG